MGNHQRNKFQIEYRPPSFAATLTLVPVTTATSPRFFDFASSPNTKAKLPHCCGSSNINSTAQKENYVPLISCLTA